MLRTIRTDPAIAQEQAREVYDKLLANSRYVTKPNFDRIHTGDLAAIFDSYDQLCFQGALRKAVGNVPLTFHLSKRMTSSGGMLVHRFQKRGRKTETLAFELKISSTLLFQTFHDVDRPIRVNGIECHNRLEALQRVVEHEIVHLAETLEWGTSSCFADRFRDIAHRFFAHTEHTHELVTQTERAATKFALAPGDTVLFQFEGQKLTGVINRITRRATVLVEDIRGESYNDGKRYLKYYVPLEGLKRA